MSEHFIRIAWIGLALGLVILFLTSLPVTFSHLLMICRHGTCDSTQLSVHRAVDLSRLGIPRALYAAYFLGLFTLLAVVNVAVGGIIFRRRSDDRGALLVATFLVTLGVSFPDVIDWQATQGPMGALLSSLVSAFFGVLVVGFFYLFPDGHFVPRWTPWLLGATFWWQTANALAPTTLLNPQTWPQPLPTVLLLTLLGSVLFAQVYRYQHVSTQFQRQQTKLVVLGTIGALLIFVGLVLIANLALTAAARDSVIGTGIALTIYQVAWLAVPFTVGVAILRHRLYDIDVLINRALVYGSLTISIVVIYAGIVLGLQFLVPVVSGQHSDLTIAVATLAVAGLFNPLRARLQALIDRKFYRRKYDAARALASLSSHLRDEVDLDRLSHDLLTVVHDTVQPDRVAIWLAEPGEPL